jgi:FAD/FMN-containing dehydrogenase
VINEQQLAKVISRGSVSGDPSITEQYSQDISFVNKIRPKYVAKVKDRNEIEGLVRLANETLTPLVPVSSGPPHFKGDTVPGAGNSVIVDLSDLKQIVRVDRPNRVAMFEPGVTFGELIPAVEKAGLRLNMPLRPRKTKSVVGSMLEREPVILPKYHWDIADPLCNVEIVLGNGTLFRTGSAAGPGTLEEQWKAGGAQKEAAGPSTASWYRLVQASQGSMGIVTWASARCEVLPKVEEPFLVGSNDIVKILEMVHWLVRLRLVNECLILNSTELSAISTEKWPRDYSLIKAGLPEWILVYNLAAYEYFPAERVAGQIQDIFDLSQKVGLEPVKALGKIVAEELLQSIRSPSVEPYWKLRMKGACEDVFFLTNFERIPRLIHMMLEEAQANSYSPSEVGIYIQPLVQGTNFHCEFSLFYDSLRAREVEQVKTLSKAAIKRLMAAGAFFSRPYGEATALIMNRDAASLAALKKVKTILDPNRIMNPGKLCL